MSNPFADVRWIWKNGQLIDFEKATVHVLSHALHYGSGVFEGIRCYNTAQGSAVFRLREHIRRLENSAKVYRMPVAFTTDELMDAVCETIRANELESCYIRPIVFRGFGNTIGVNPLHNPVEVFIACWPWGKYLGEEAENGVDVCVSSWRRISADSMPAVAKATGNYLNAQLIKIEAITNGYVEGIALDARGYVSEGSGENVFMVQDGLLMTPPLAASVPGDHPRRRAADRGRPRHPGAPGGADPARTALHLRRAVHDRHRRRDHAHPLRGPQPGRSRLPGRDHPADHGAFPRHRHRRDRGPPRLAARGPS